MSLALVAAVLFPAAASAQLASPGDRLDKLEARVAELQKEIDRLRSERKKKKKKTFADGIEMLGGTKLRLGGKAEILFIRTEKGSFGSLGAAGVTDEPDPHLRIQRIRLSPEIELNRQVTVEGQLEFEPEKGDTVLRELVARHRARPAWWFASRLQIGLDDRFIRPDRRTKGYPLIGNAFWRKETPSIIWRLSFGDRRGRPTEEEEEPASSGRTVGTEGFDGGAPSGIEGRAKPFDFENNWGEVRTYLSVGQGFTLDTNQTNFDRAAFDDLVVDARDLRTDLALREIGVGLGYRRSFRELGDLSVLGFYYNDELRDASVQFLQEQLTVRDTLGNATAGYGDSSDSRSYRYGGTIEYFLPAESLFGSVLDPEPEDGLRVLAQYIKGVDGDLERSGWFVQGSYRFSFGRLVADRYFRSLEPIVRYGVLDVDLAPVASLPGTWDRQQLSLAGILEVTGDIYVKAEYSFSREETGAGDVDNDELLVELLLEF